MSGLVTGYFAWRLEVSRSHAEILYSTEDKFEASHSAVITKAGIYANRLLDERNAPGQKEEILSAIIDAQSQLLVLRTQLKPEDYNAVSAYAVDLNRLRDAVRGVHRYQDLNRVYASLQRLLADRKNIALRVKENARITLL
jgi:hypothetical protein